MPVIFVSIILPVYNRQETIAKAIQSVLDQTYPHFELIIVDDGSTDKSSKVIASFSDERIRYIRFEQNYGANAARNAGIKEAKWPWIAFHDSDDYWMKEKLEKQIELIHKNNRYENPIIYTSFIRYNSGQTEYIPGDNRLRKEGFIHKELLLGNFISTQTVMLTKEQLVNVGYFDEELPRFQDWELWIRMSKKYPFIWINEPLVHVYYSEDSISSSKVKLLNAFELILKKHATTFQEAGAPFYSSLLFSYGHNLFLAGQMQEGRKRMKESIKAAPFHIKSSVKCLFSYFCSLLGQYFYKRIYNLIRNN